MKKDQINLGLLTGGIFIVLFLLFAIMEGGFMIMMLIWLLSIVTAIVGPLIFIKKRREANGGTISFKEAFILGFVGLAIGGAMSTLFSMIYVQLIDPEIGERIAFKTLEMMQGFMEGNVPEEQMKEALIEAEQDTLDRFTVMGQVKGFFTGLIMYGVIVAIVAAATKKSPEQLNQ